MGSVRAGRWGPLCRDMEAGGMWKHRQVVGVRKGQGWVHEVMHRKRGAGHVHQCGQELAPPGTGNRWEGCLGRAGRAGVRQGPGRENRAWGRYLGKRSRRGGVR